MKPGDLFGYTQYLRIVYDKRRFTFLTAFDDKCEVLSYNYLDEKNLIFVLIEEIKFNKDDFKHPESWDLLEYDICWKVLCGDKTFWILLSEDERQYLRKLK